MFDYTTEAFPPKPHFAHITIFSKGRLLVTSQAESTWSVSRIMRQVLCFMSRVPVFLPLDSIPSCGAGYGWSYSASASAAGGAAGAAGSSFSYSSSISGICIQAKRPGDCIRANPACQWCAQPVSAWQRLFTHKSWLLARKIHARMLIAYLTCWGCTGQRWNESLYS